MRIHYLIEEAKPGHLKAQDDPAFPFLGSASARFAGTYPGQVLAGAGHDVSYHFVNKHTGAHDDLDIQTGDVVVCIRSYFQEMADTAQAAQKKGAVVVMQQNDPHIASKREDLKSVRATHRQILKLADGVIANSAPLACLCAQYAQTVTVIFDGVDTARAAPDFNAASTPLKLVTACYPQNHGDILHSLPSMESFAAGFGPVQYTVVTKPPRADQAHHGNDYDRLAGWKPETSNFTMKLEEYSPRLAAQRIAECDIVVVQQDGGNRTGYKALWYPNKSNGRGAAAVQAGKPFVCPPDISSYKVFLDDMGGYYAGDAGQTLDLIVNLGAKRVNKDVAAGQDIIDGNNSTLAIAAQQFDFFKKLREKRGFYGHGPRPR